MYMASNELASRFSVIRENLQKMKEAMAKGLYQDAMLLATQVNSSTGQLAAELARFSK
jgi:phytoene/squalene synthetase